MKAEKVSYTETFVCVDCGMTNCCWIKGELGSNYSTDHKDKRRCRPCSNERELEMLKDRSLPFNAYVNSEGSRVTTWIGGVLGVIIATKPCKLARTSWVHGDEFFSYRVRDLYGGYWHGRGSPGVCITLRPCKG